MRPNFRPVAMMVTCCAALVWCGPLGAETIYSGLNFDVEISEPLAVGDGSESLLMLQLTLVGKGDALPAGFDGVIRGPLHQQSAAEVITPSLDEPLEGSVFLTDIDTHFGIRNTDLIAVFALSETLGAVESSREASNATGPQAAAARTSLGTSLSGTFARIDEFEPSWLLAQIVVPSGSTVALDFELGLRGGSFEAAMFSFEVVRPAILSDLTRDGFVDADDLFVLLGHWNELDASAAVGNIVDPLGSTIDANDLFTLLAEWTGPDPSPLAEAALAAEAIPEPSSLVLLGLGALALCRVRRRRYGAESKTTSRIDRKAASGGR